MRFTCVIRYGLFFVLFSIHVVIVYCRRAAPRSKLEPLTSISIYILIFYAMSGMRFHLTLYSVHGRTWAVNRAYSAVNLTLSFYVYSCLWVCLCVCIAHKMQFSNFPSASCWALFFAVCFLYFVLLFIHCLCARTFSHVHSIAIV